MTGFNNTQPGFQFAQMANDFTLWYAKRPEAFEDEVSYDIFYDIREKVQNGDFPFYKMYRLIDWYNSRFAEAKNSN